MDLYRHYTNEQLAALRDRLTTSLHDRLTKATSVGSGDRNARFDQQTAEIRKEAAAVIAEIDRRRGTNPRGPIYLV